MVHQREPYQRQHVLLAKPATRALCLNISNLLMVNAPYCGIRSRADVRCLCLLLRNNSLQLLTIRLAQLQLAGWLCWWPHLRRSSSGCGISARLISGSMCCWRSLRHAALCLGISNLLMVNAPHRGIRSRADVRCLCLLLRNSSLQLLVIRLAQLQLAGWLCWWPHLRRGSLRLWYLSSLCCFGFLGCDHTIGKHKQPFGQSHLGGGCR